MTSMPLGQLPIRLPANASRGACWLCPPGRWVTMDLDARPQPRSAAKKANVGWWSLPMCGGVTSAFVNEARSQIEAKVRCLLATGPPGAARLNNQSVASQRLAIVVPVALLLVFVLLFAMFQRCEGWPAGVHGRAVRLDGRCGRAVAA